LDNRDVVLRARGGRLEQISQNSPSYSALYYVLLFPKGENGWHPRIPIRGAQLRERGENARQRDGEKRARSQVVSDTCYYAYYLHVRDGPQPPLFYGGKLFQQFVVDAWANCEQRKLNWARTHQHTLISKLYQGLQDATVHDRHDGEDVGPLGCKLILPSSHVGSPRFMIQLFQDAMAICRYFHKPDLFLTITANPKWPKIIYSFFPGQTATNCSNIVSRVFEQKKKTLLKLIDNGFFGTTIAYIHTIEFQKRDLLHIYLLIFLYPQHRIQDSHHINSMISAQFSDPQLQLLLYAKVTKYMLYGSCGVDNLQAKCMVNGKYSKRFPKEYRERTDWAKNSYSLYARPDNSLVFECNGARFTNQYMIPYCPQLLLLFDCYLNVEISARLKTIKYLSKYIYKGPDRITMEISDGMQDEIKTHLDS